MSRLLPAHAREEEKVQEQTERRASGASEDVQGPADEPGRTPGKAEGERGEPTPEAALHEPGRTPSQAEGSRETVEEDLRRKQGTAK